MQVAVVGEHTLAEAVAQCCAKHFSVTRVPTFEADVLWVCYDTPVGERFQPDNESVLRRIREDLTRTRPSALTLVSSQLRVGTTAKLELEYPDRAFAHSPENVRAATAVKDFEWQERIIVGVRNDHHIDLLTHLLIPFTAKLIFTDPETAECVKHALNGFLALQIAYINEIERVCSAVGADPRAVADALRLDKRVSPHAPLRPGQPYGGGHLEREVWNLRQLTREHQLMLPLIANIELSNWMYSKFCETR